MGNRARVRAVPAMMATSVEATLDWQRACVRGAAIGAIVAAHLVLVVALVPPPSPRQPAVRKAQASSNVLRVELLAAQPALPPRAPRPVARARARRAPQHRSARTRSIAPRPSAGPRISLVPAAPATAAGPPPFIAGGGFGARLRAAQTSPHVPKLPGGQRYLASDLQFVPLAQESIAAHVHKIAGFLGLGWFDPACKNIEHELAKSQLQMIADGYTERELERHLRAHHCR